MIMGGVTHEQVNLMLRLYELRREPRLRQAREWFIREFSATNWEEFQKQCPPGSEAHTNWRMMVSYWEMVASIVNRGLIEEDFFFEQGAEQFLVWDRAKGVIGELRSKFKSPHSLANLEQHCEHLEAWWKRRAPGALEILRQNVRQAIKPAAQAAGTPKD